MGTWCERCTGRGNNTNGRARGGAPCAVCTARANGNGGDERPSRHGGNQGRSRQLAVLQKRMTYQRVELGLVRRFGGAEGIYMHSRLHFKSLPFLAGGCRLHLGGYCKKNRGNVRLRGISGTVAWAFACTIRCCADTYLLPILCPQMKQADWMLHVVAWC